MATSKIRVLRLLEYTYDSVEAMERDRPMWQIQGDRKYGATRIKSVTLPLEVLAPDEPTGGPTASFKARKTAERQAEELEHGSILDDGRGM